MPEPITKQTIIDFIRANADRTNPDSGMTWEHKYNGNPRLTVGACFYFAEDGTPGCVIGNVLADAGYGPLDIEEDDSASALFEWNLNDTSGLGDFAQSIQKRADRGYTWGTALTLALMEEGNGT